MVYYLGVFKVNDHARNESKRVRLHGYLFSLLLFLVAFLDLSALVCLFSAPALVESSFLLF